jgi:PAS domain S-box-containing protein
MTSGIAHAALIVVDHTPAMLAYWDDALRCRFANAAYLQWMGKSREEALGAYIHDLLGPLYQQNLPHILGALRGEPQIFERTLPAPNGQIRHVMATYTPHIDVDDGAVRGFIAHIADVTPMKALEASLREANAALQHSLDQMRELRVIVPICVYCKSVRTDQNHWQPVETYIHRFTAAQFSHGICPQCYEKATREMLP